jgi:hypothetical protein
MPRKKPGGASLESKKERKEGTLFSPPFRSSRDLQHHLTLFSLFFYISFCSLSLSFSGLFFSARAHPMQEQSRLLSRQQHNAILLFFLSFLSFFLFFFFFSCLNNRKSAKEKRKADLHRRSTRTFINFFLLFSF